MAVQQNKKNKILAGFNNHHWFKRATYPKLHYTCQKATMYPFISVIMMLFEKNIKITITFSR